MGNCFSNKKNQVHVDTSEIITPAVIAYKKSIDTDDKFINDKKSLKSISSKSDKKDILIEDLENQDEIDHDEDKKLDTDDKFINDKKSLKSISSKSDKKDILIEDLENQDEIDHDKDKKLENDDKFINEKKSLKSISSKSDKTDILIEDLENQDEIDYNIDEWKNLIKSLIDNKKIYSYVISKPRERLSSLEELKVNLKNYPANNDIERAWLIYLWITHNIKYDFPAFLNGDYTGNDSESVFRKGKCICQGYSTLFTELCEELDVECIPISGYSKGYSYKIGMKFKKTDHAWNAIRINEKWHYVESTWGAGSASEGENQSKSFNPYYFMTPPQIFIYDHFSKFEQYQSNKITLEQFESLINFKLNFHLTGLKLLTEVSSQIETSKNPYFLELLAPKETSITVDLYTLDDQKIENTILIQRDAISLKYGIILFFPKINTKFILKLFSKNSILDEDNKSFNLATQFEISCDNQLVDYNLPKYRLTFNDYGLECISHGCSIITSTKNPVFLEFSSPKETQILPSLYEENRIEEIRNSFIVQRDATSFKYGIILFIPRIKETFIFKLFAKNANQDKDKFFSYVTEFLIICQNQLQYYDLPKYELEFDQGVRCLSHGSKLINSTQNPTQMEFSAPSETLFLVNLFDENASRLENFLLIQRNVNTSNYELSFILPNKGKNFKIKIFAKDSSDRTTESYSFLTEFFVLKNFDTQNEERKFISFYSSNLEFYVFSPIFLELKLNKPHKFKVYVKDAKEVTLLLGPSDWISLYRGRNEKDVWTKELVFDSVGQLKLYAKSPNANTFSGICSYEIVE